MFSFSKNLATEIKANRLMWMSVDKINTIPTEPLIKEPVTANQIETAETQKKSETIDPLKTFDPKKNTELAVKNNAQEKVSQDDDLKELPKIEKEWDAAYAEKESHEIPSELQKMTRAEIRNLERKNPEELLKACFWKIEEDGTLTPIGNSTELKSDDEIQFSVAESSGKNKNLEMGAGLRTLPDKFNVVQIGEEKFYRIYAGGPFVDAEGNYRAVRSHKKETITLLTEEAPDDIKNKIKNRGSEYRQADASNLFSEFAKSIDDLKSPEFKAKIEQAKSENPELTEFLNISEEDQARLNLQPTNDNRSMRNNNPGNLKYIGQAGAIGAVESGFARFATLESGTLAHKNQIRIDAKRDYTVLEFTQKYLGMKPGGIITETVEGNAVAYAKAISDNPDVKLKDLDVNTVQKAMQKHEGWNGPEDLKS
jgi:hypothetical protein